MRGFGSEQRARPSGRAAAALVEIDAHAGSRPWPHVIAPKRHSARQGHEAALAEATLAQARARERAAVARIVQLHGELKAREVQLREARRAAAVARRDADALRVRLAAAQAALDRAPSRRD